MVMLLMMQLNFFQFSSTVIQLFEIDIAHVYLQFKLIKHSLPLQPCIYPIFINPQKKMKELLVRLMYCEMLGHSASFGHITALKMAQQGSLHLKRVGMLAFQPRMTTFFVKRRMQRIECSNLPLTFLNPQRIFQFCL